MFLIAGIDWFRRGEDSTPGLLVLTNYNRGASIIPDSADRDESLEERRAIDAQPRPLRVKDWRPELFFSGLCLAKQFLIHDFT